VDLLLRFIFKIANWVRPLPQRAPAGEEFMLLIIWRRVESGATRILIVHRSA